MWVCFKPLGYLCNTCRVFAKAQHFEIFFVPLSLAAKVNEPEVKFRAFLIWGLEKQQTQGWLATKWPLVNNVFPILKDPAKRHAPKISHQIAYDVSAKQNMVMWQRTQVTDWTKVWTYAKLLLDQVPWWDWQKELQMFQMQWSGSQSCWYESWHGSAS